MANRLSGEQSPYLLQHADNPVDWYPWGDEAFARARAEDKPIFLSIGYSTCHWCHVMAHESFESAAVADVLNRHFVPVKVDREERPDVDRVYMTFVQATTGSGGWPLSVWITPALEPFYGGTYYPPAPRWGRPGFVDVLTEVARAWREERAQVVASAASILAHLHGARRGQGGREVPGPAATSAAVNRFMVAFDSDRGGFGDAPKFPRPGETLFLLREHARTGHPEAREMALVTLRAMALGGMRDHIGGGFHRYSVDAAWRVPHFEKMLYDQAQLALAYTEAAQLTGEAQYADVARDTLAYVARDLTDPAGGFHSAEDADSLPPGDPAGQVHGHPREGAFYVWSEAEVRDVLGADADIVCLRYGVRPDGNAPFDPQGEFSGQNLLYVARSLDEVSRATGRDEADIESVLARSRERLWARRATRPRPHLDDKVLTAWNGLMIAACARAARTLEHAPGALAQAQRAAGMLRATVWDDASGRLWRRYRGGHVGIAAFAEDYACLIFGLLELFQADGDPAWLEWALTLQEQLDTAFADREGGGWFNSSGADETVLVRMKDEQDGAEPSVAALSALNLRALGLLTGREALLARAEQALGAAGPYVPDAARAVPMMLVALSTYHAAPIQVVVAGDPVREDTRALLAVVRQRYMPSAVVVPLRPHFRDALARLLPWTASLAPVAGEPAAGASAAAAYVCRHFSCELPSLSPAALAAELDAVV
ncbi:MAG: thioredoxin domain-containing protein [Vicinamibacterales bacterium]